MMERIMLWLLCVIFGFSEIIYISQAQDGLKIEKTYPVNRDKFISNSDNITENVIRIKPSNSRPINEKILMIGEHKNYENIKESSFIQIQRMFPLNRLHDPENYGRQLQRPYNKLHWSSGTNTLDNINAMGIKLRKIQLKKRPELEKKQKQKLRCPFELELNSNGPKKVGRNMDAYIDSGEYPIFYAFAKTNGRFDKFSLRNIRWHSNCRSGQHLPKRREGLNET